jgi:hypothetical protein
MEFIFPIIFSPSKLAFQPTERSRMVQHLGSPVAAACVWIGKHSISLGLVLPCEPLHRPDESKSMVCEIFRIWLHFLSEWTKHFFTKEWWISCVIFWKPAIVCDPVNSPENDQHAFSFAIVVLTRPGSSASAGSQIVPGFMSRETHISSPVIRSRRWHLPCICRTSSTFQSFDSQIIIKKKRNHLKCRLFMLREVVRWRGTVNAGILRNSAIVRTEDNGSASKTCRIRALISSRGVGRSSVGHSDQNDVT